MAVFKHTDSEQSKLFMIALEDNREEREREYSLPNHNEDDVDDDNNNNNNIEDIKEGKGLG